MATAHGGRHPATMDPLDEFDRIAVVLDHRGRIVRVNEAWHRAGTARGMPDGDAWLGRSYTDLTAAAAADGVPGAAATLAALRRLSAGETQREEVGYPCDAPDEDAWKTVVLRSLPDGGVLAVHLDAPDPRALRLSEQRLAELAYRRLLRIDTRCAWCRRMADPDGAWSTRPVAPSSSVTDGLCERCEAELTAALEGRGAAAQAVAVPA
jgi:hypothetical protein